MTQPGFVIMQSDLHMHITVMFAQNLQSTNMLLEIISLFIIYFIHISLLCKTAYHRITKCHSDYTT